MKRGGPAPRVFAVLALVAAMGAGPARAGEAQAATTAIAVGWSLDHDALTTRLSFDVSRPAEVQARLLEAPDRIVVDLPQVAFQIDGVAGGGGKPRTAGLVRSFRFGLFAPGRSRVVIDLAGPATITRLGSTTIAGGDPSRLTIELASATRDTFHKAVQAAALAPPLDEAPAPVSPPATAASTRPVIVIDPGHGGVDPGASGVGGVVEKTITFDFASALVDRLNASGRYTAVLTRKDDSFVSLGDRVKVARDANAALFVSIHADTLAASAGVTGATVYTCSDKASDAEAARVAATENEADAAAGLDSVPQAPGVNDILFDLTRRETRTYAHLFQRTLVGYWQKIARVNKNPERAAGFKVLQAPDVPSVLLELGYLSSDRDVRSLTSPEWRAQAAGSVVTAIDAFFAPRHAPIPATKAADATATVPQGGEPGPPHAN